MNTWLGFPVWEQRCPEIHLFGARFREQQGDVKGARLSYELLSSELAPGLLEAIIKHANFEQRQVCSTVRVIQVMNTNVSQVVRDCFWIVYQLLIFVLSLLYRK